ncbi:MAG: hypothetical protein ABIO60_14000 [Aquaticitalea sp.]
MKKKAKLEGTVDAIAGRKIYININHLEKGAYKLHIIHNNKILISTKFNKE